MEVAAAPNPCSGEHILTSFQNPNIVLSDTNGGQQLAEVRDLQLSTGFHSQSPPEAARVLRPPLDSLLPGFFLRLNW